MRNKKLEDEIHNYIRTHQDMMNIDFHTICGVFSKSNEDTIKTTLSHLRVNKRIFKIQLTELYYKYIINNLNENK